MPSLAVLGKLRLQSAGEGTGNTFFAKGIAPLTPSKAASPPIRRRCGDKSSFNQALARRRRIRVIPVNPSNESVAGSGTAPVNDKTRGPSFHGLLML